MLLTEKLQQEIFPSSQQAVVDFLLRDPLAVKDMTIRQLAKKTYTSNATMIRIAQRFHYSGWEEFRDDFLKEQEYLALRFSDVDPNLPFTPEDSLASIAAKIAELKMEAIQDTLNLLDQNALKTAAEVLNRSRTIIILASNNTYMLAQLFALKLGRIHKLALAMDPKGEIHYNGLLEQPDTCIVAISYSGETAALLQLMRDAKAAGNPILALTSIGDNSVTRLADVILRFCTREKMYSKINWYTTEAGIEYLLDLLYSALFWKDYDRNLETRVSTARRWESARKSSDSTIAEIE